MTERVKRAPYSVILLDEIEKAHPRHVAVGVAAAPGPAGPLLGATAFVPGTLRPELFFVLVLLGLRPVLLALHSPALPTLQHHLHISVDAASITTTSAYGSGFDATSVI